VVAALLAALVANVPAVAGTERTVDADTGLATWAWEDGQARITLSQLLPDQVRAFFQGRGFSPAQSEVVARACGFQMVVRNAAGAPGAMAIELGAWRVQRPGAESAPPRVAASWEAEWARLGVAPASRIAFRWALFPAEQAFQPGDWNMGMLLLEVPAGAVFDLHATWRIDGQARAAALDGVRCAEDR
jgi:hypothetical protein